MKKSLTSTAMFHSEMNVDSESYLNNTNKYDSMKSWGMTVIPVDLNSAFVPTDKNGKDNLDVTEDNIRDRFALDEPNDEDSN